MKLHTLALSTAIAFVLLFAHASATSNHYRPTVCSDGFPNAYTIVQMDDVGCIIRIVGVNCDNEPINWSPPHELTILSGDPMNPFDVLVTDGPIAYVKIKLNSAGGVQSVWGRKANGDYYTT